jgi:uncharacterized protein (TIGR02996 family)
MPNADHPEYAALLRAICADPDDDTPRLVAADWLEEHGDADRAAFIRIQVELARLEVAGLGKSLEAYEWRKKERAYLGPYSVYPSIWAAEACPQLVRVIPGERGKPLESMRVEGADRVTFRRGFVEGVICPAAEWLRHGEAVRKRQPVRVLTLVGCDALGWGQWLAALPTLHWLRVLRLADFDTRLMEWLPERLHGSRVEWLPAGTIPF